MKTQKSIRTSFSLTNYSDDKETGGIKFDFKLFSDDSIGLVITLNKKEYQMIAFVNISDLKDRGAGFGLTSENIMFASRILNQV